MCADGYARLHTIGYDLHIVKNKIFHLNLYTVCAISDVIISVYQIIFVLYWYNKQGSLNNYVFYFTSLLDYQNSGQMTESPLVAVCMGYQMFSQNIVVIVWLLTYPPVPFTHQNILILSSKVGG